MSKESAIWQIREIGSGPLKLGRLRRQKPSVKIGNCSNLLFATFIMIVLAQQSSAIGGGPSRYYKHPAALAPPKCIASESRRQILVSGLAAAFAFARPPPAVAVGLEAGQLDLPSLPSISSVVEQQKATAALRLEDAEKHFQVCVCTLVRACACF